MRWKFFSNPRSRNWRCMLTSLRSSKAANLMIITEENFAPDVYHVWTYIKCINVYQDSVFTFSFLLNSVNPHFPQLSLSLCSAINAPFPHLGQSLFDLYKWILYRFSPNYLPLPDPFASEEACFAFNLAAFSSSIIFFLSSLDKFLNNLYRGT